MAALTSTEYSLIFNTGLAAFAETCEEEMEGELYGMLRQDKTVNANKLWLYVYALNSWDNTDGAFNYLTETQMLGLVSRLQEHGL